MVKFEALKQSLLKLTPAQLRNLAERSGVPVHTLAKIRSGETPNPRIRTVEKLWDVLDAPAASVTAEEGAA